MEGEVAVWQGKHGEKALWEAMGSDEWKSNAQKVRALMDADRGALTKKFAIGFLPIHIAAQYKASAEAIAVLLQGYPEGAGTKNNNGYLPLYYAAQYKASAEAIVLLHDANPAALQTLDADNKAYVEARLQQGAAGARQAKEAARELLSRAAAPAAQNFFVSYKQNDTNDGATMLMYAKLKEMGHVVWLDKISNDKSTEAMVKGVTECTTFLAVLSPQYFTSWYCSLEMHTAIRLKKPMHVLFNNAKVTVQVALGWIPQDLKKLMDNELLPVHEDVQVMVPALERIIATAAKPYSGALPDTLGAYTAKQAAAESVKGLSDLLSSIYLGNQIEAARSWCIEIGADDVADLKEEDYAERLAAALELPEIKAKKLVKALRGV